MRFHLLSSAFAVATLACLSLSAQAVTVDRARLQQMTSSQKADYYKSLAERARGAAGKNVHADRDAHDPKLTSFTMTPPADVAAPYAQLVIDLSAIDNLSGVSDWVLQLDGPSGQTLQVYSKNDGLPAQHYRNRTAVDVTSYVEPGTWTLEFLLVSDYEGNVVYYNPDLIQGLGDSRVTFVNSRPGEADAFPPALKFGKVLTPTVKVSGHPKGTRYASPLIAADFEVTDDHSGLHLADASWCLHDHTSCVAMDAEDGQRGLVDGVLHAVGYLSGKEPAGDYELFKLHLVDQAGNEVYLFSTHLGGEFDFAPYMPGGQVMTLKP